MRDPLFIQAFGFAFFLFGFSICIMAIVFYDLLAIAFGATFMAVGSGIYLAAAQEVKYMLLRGENYIYRE